MVKSKNDSFLKIWWNCCLQKFWKPLAHRFGWRRPWPVRCRRIASVRRASRRTEYAAPGRESWTLHSHAPDSAASSSQAHFRLSNLNQISFQNNISKKNLKMYAINVWREAFDICCFTAYRLKNFRWRCSCRQWARHRRPWCTREGVWWQCHPAPDSTLPPSPPYRHCGALGPPTKTFRQIMCRALEKAAKENK